MEKTIKRTLAIIFLLIIIPVFAGCVALNKKSNEKIAGKTENLIEKPVENPALIIKGEIDYLKEIESFSLKEKDEKMNLTIVGFKTGQGVLLLGIYPGLKEGKKVKIYLNSEQTATYRGTPVYKSSRIEEWAGE